MTMIELLIVVAVMVILLGIALPVMKTGIEGRKLREAAREVNTAATLAKAMTAETGRFAGLVLDTESLPEDTTKIFARRLFLAETPPPYAGDVLGAVATIDTSTGSLRADFLDGKSANLANVAKLGDLIRFNYRNPLYQITSITSGGTLGTYILALIALPGSPGSPWPNHGSVLPYQVIRKPEKSSSTPFELPNGAVIDMTQSGFGLAGTSLDTTAMLGAPPRPSPVTIMFGPSGRMMGVMGLSPALTNMPTETLHLLIGNLEKLGTDNRVDPSTLWVSIGHQTGRVTTAESGASASATTIQAAREFAESAQAKGGL